MAVNHKEDSEQEALNSGRGHSGFARLSMAIFLVLVYPLLSMVWHHQYPVFSTEIALLLGGFLVASVVLSVVLGRYCRSSVVNIVLVTIMTLAFLIHFNFFFIGLIATLSSGLVLSLLLKDKFPAVLTVLMVALITGSYFDNRIDRNSNAPGAATGQPSSQNGPVIHILMDGFIGPDGLPQTEESQNLRADMMTFFETNDFQLHTRAYSHYSNTTDSMTRAFNFRNDDVGLYERIVALRIPISFRENAWFRALNRMGYPVVVYQTDSVNFCEIDPPLVSQCNVFTLPNLKTIHEDVDAIRTRSAVLMRALYSQSTLITTILHKNQMGESWGVSVYDKSILTSLARDVRLEPGKAYFAHVLLPHSPLVYRQDCSLDYSTDPWQRFPADVGWVGNSDETRSVRYGKYVQQTRCALKELGTLFDQLRRDGLYDKATIVVHGDHGSSAHIFKPSALIRNKRPSRDFRETFSILFAVKYPGGSFSVHDQIIALNVLMAQTVSRITGRSWEELDINMLNEDQPFIYLSDVQPLKRVNVDIFEPGAAEAANDP